MSPKTRQALWVILAAGPLVAGILTFLMMPAGVQQVPLHWDFQGNVNGYGHPASTVGLGALMTAVNIFLAYCYYHSDAMHDAGVVHGVSKESAPKVILGCAVLILVVSVVICIAISVAPLGA